MSQRSTTNRRATLTAIGFLLPNLLGFLGFTVFPVVFSLYMAFTNWTPKPAVEFQVVGMRNFVDLLGVQPKLDPDPGLVWSYGLFVLLASLGYVAMLWANVAGWRGIRWGGLTLLCIGIAMWATAMNKGSGQGPYIAALLTMVLGFGSLARTMKPFDLGPGIVPPVMIGLAGLMLSRLGGSMWNTYILNDERFWQYFYNTAYLMLGIPFGIAGSLALAMLLNQEFEQRPWTKKLIYGGLCIASGVVSMFVLWQMGQKNIALLSLVLWAIAALGLMFNVLAFRTIFYLPSFTAGVALLILWKALYNPEIGPINVGLRAIFDVFGIQAEPPQWLASVEWAKPAMIIMGVWTGIGGTNMLLYLAGLSNVQGELLDAADVDGASKWQRFAQVVWPQLAPTTFFISIMSVIGGLQGGFEQARVMTGGGPAGSTTTLSYYIYNKAFQDLDLGYAAAISWVLFGVIFVATAMNWKFGKELEVEP